MMGEIPPNGFDPAWRKLRDDVNILAYLFEEERTITRLYIESAFWALTGKRFSVDEFRRELGIGSSDKSPTDDPERSAQSALDSSGESEI